MHERFWNSSPGFVCTRWRGFGDESYPPQRRWNLTVADMAFDGQLWALTRGGEKPANGHFSLHLQANLSLTRVQGVNMTCMLALCMVRPPGYYKMHNPNPSAMS